jgi:hypothetical protein
LLRDHPADGAQRKIRTVHGLAHASSVPHSQLIRWHTTHQGFFALAVRDVALAKKISCLEGVYLVGQRAIAQEVPQGATRDFVSWLRACNKTLSKQGTIGGRSASQNLLGGSAQNLDRPQTLCYGF